MSITLSGEVRATTSLFNMVEEFQHFHQYAISEAARAGEAYLRDEANDSVHTPIRMQFRGLIESVERPYMNQYGVTFRIGGIVTDRMDGKQKPYGFAQEFGYHDRANGYHEGHHMVEHAAEVRRRDLRRVDVFAGDERRGLAGGTVRNVFRRINIATLRRRRLRESARIE
jgi:hypothetical protein